MPTTYKTLADLTTARLAALVPTTNLGDLAEKAGFQSERTLLLIADGETKLPIDRFGPFSDALDADRAEVLYLTLRQFLTAEMVDEMVELFATRFRRVKLE